MNAISTLSSLSSEEKNFLKTKQITGAKTPDEWLNFFRKLKDFDTQSDKTRKAFSFIGWAGLTVAFIGIFLIGFVIGFVIIPLGVLIAAVCLGVYFYLKSYDITGSVLDNTLVPMILILREEMNVNERLKLRLDLRGFSLPEKFIKQNPSYSRGSYYEIKDSFYRDRWMDGETEMADGTRLIWTIEDFVRSSHKKKRNSRGKYKSKTKNKTRTFVSMQIGMNNKRYSLPEKIKQKTNDGTIRTKDTNEHSWMSVRKVIKNASEQYLNPQEFVNTVATAYSRATPAGGGRK